MGKAQKDRYLIMASFNHTTLFGNVMSVNASQSGKVKFISLSPADFRPKAESKTPLKPYSIAVFENNFDQLAELETALAAVREAKGNDRAALTQVKLDAFVNPATGEDGHQAQLQLSRIVSIGAAKAQATEKVAEAEAK